jgi:hypothetical protein
MDQLERLHIQVQIETLESQKLAAAAIVKNSQYMQMSVVMATIATTISISSALPASFAERGRRLNIDSLSSLQPFAFAAL